MASKAPTSFNIDNDRRTIVITHVFDAPRALVFKVMTDPKLLPQWWGPRRLTTVVEKMDLKAGGKWRYIQHDPEGNEYAFNGVYREILPPERLVYTFEYEGTAGHVVLETVTFEDIGGKTRVTTRDVFESVEDLQGMVQSGMEGGVVESFERMVELLAKQKVAQ